MVPVFTLRWFSTSQRILVASTYETEKNVTKGCRISLNIQTDTVPGLLNAKMEHELVFLQAFFLFHLYRVKELSFSCVFIHSFLFLVLLFN